MKDKNIIVVQNFLRCLDLGSLKNSEVVANLVRTFGIMPWVHPGMIMTGPETEFINPQGMAAIGQTPDQIAKALVYLSAFKINSFCEIGVCYGGNFLFMSEYLRRFNPEIKCMGIDPTNYLDSKIREIIDLSDWMRFVSLTSDQLAGRKFDLVFIDGDHTGPWIAKDYENLGKFARFCMFHDIQETLWPDAIAHWAEMKGLPKKVAVEFLDCYPDRATHGIGIIYDKERKES